MTAEPTALLDVGKSTLRLEVRGLVPSVVHSEPVRGWLGDPASRQVLLDQFGHLEVAGSSTVVVVGAAIAGLAAADDATRVAVLTALRQTFPNADTITLVSDADAAHAGAFGGAPGVLLIVGTGAVALGLTGDGTRYQADGRGPLLGDEGSGGWIGREGCLAAVRAVDERGPATVLTSLARARYDVAPLQLAGLIAASTKPAAEFGRFARDVLDAWMDGDAEAQRIVDEAAERLATSAASVLIRMPADARRLVMVGGLSQHEPFRRLVLQRVAASVPADFPAALGTALDGAAVLLRA